MDTLMRTITPLLLVGALLAGLATDARAQTQQDRWFFNVNFGGQIQDESFTDSSTFLIYNEQGATASAHSFGGGMLFNISAGGLVWRDVGIGLSYSHNSNKNDATATVRVPNPIVFGQFREASTTVSDIEHKEDVVHLHFFYQRRVTDKIKVLLMAGPSFFNVHQQIVTVNAPADIIDSPPSYTTVTIKSATVTETKDSPVGFNVGVDGTYDIRRFNVPGLGPVGVGVGLFGRYSGATAKFPTVEGFTRDGNPTAGGLQGGIGLRLGF
jgi:hypothetical protein